MLEETTISFQDPKERWWYDIAAASLCVAVLFLALVVGYHHKVGTFDVEADFYGVYAIQAENIIDGRPYTYQHNPPGYCVLLAFVSFLAGDLFVAGKIISAFATAIFGWITYMLFKALFDVRIALTAIILLLIALLPYSFVAATDTVGAAVMMVPIWLFLRQPAITKNECFITGIFAGIAYLIRYNAVFIIIGIVFSLLYIDFNKETLQKRILKICLFFCGFVMIASPWLITNWIKNGSPFASKVYGQIAANFYYQNGDELGTTIVQADSKFNSLSEVLLYDPLRLIQKYLNDVLINNIMELITQALQFPTYIFAGLGLLFLIKDLSKRRVIFIIISLLGYFLMGLVGFRLRYYLFFFPFLFLPVTYLLFQKESFSKLGYIPLLKVPVSWMVLIMLTGFLGLSSYRDCKDTIYSEPRYLLEIANVVKKHASPGELIIIRKPHLAYLSGLKAAFPLANSADEYLLKAKELGIRYIVYTERDEYLWPGLRTLRNPDILPSSFKLVYNHAPSRTLIYEIN